MTTITVPAIYRDGVLQPQIKLDLPEGATVEVQITAVQPAAPASPSLFGMLAGIWSHLSQADLEQMERDLTDIRRRSAERIERLAHELSQTLNSPDG